MQQKPAFLEDAPQPIKPASTIPTLKLYFSNKFNAHDKPVYPAPIIKISKFIFSFIDLNLSFHVYHPLSANNSLVNY